MLGTLGLWPVAGAVGASRPATAGQPAADEGDPVLVTRRDVEEYRRLKKLDLGSPAAREKRAAMPRGKIGELTISRLISGSNLISMNMHARDLDYVQPLAAHYNTEDRVLMTLKRLEEQGVNGIVLKAHNFKRFRLSRYWDEWGGQMHWLADVITRDINQFERRLVEHLDLGAASAYLWGGASDIWYHEKKQDHIVRAYEIMKRYDIPVGIGAHRLEPIMFCEREGLQPDYYIKTLHHDQYWSAHPRENRRFLEMYEAESPDHAFYHDNLFCADHQRTVEFMQDVDVPWIAFKILAAGAIPADEGFQYAFANGADFVCVGMFDFQVDEDVELTRKHVQQSRQRTRRWC